MPQGARTLKNIRRFSTISQVMVKHGLGALLDRRKRKSRGDSQPDEMLLNTAGSAPRRVRLAMEELGPSFIKLGQLLSTRADILPAAYIEELRKLQDDVAPEPFEQIRATVEKQLGRPLEDVFDSFEPEPIAAASIAQVHHGRLKNGDSVAIKVVRHQIDRKIRDDIRIMYTIAEKVERRSQLGRVLGARNLVKEFERTIFRELDMVVEAGNIEKFTNNFRYINEIHIARVHWPYVTASVLVMDFIAGTKVDQVDALWAKQIDPKQIAMIGLRSLSRQLMEFGFFHADPHPGNTLVMDDGRVSLVDFGIVGYLDEEMMHQVANVLLGYAEHDYDLVMDALQDAGLVDEESLDLKSFRRDLKDMSESFYGRSLQNITVREVYDQVMELVLKYHIRLPRNLLLLFKTLIQTEALGKILGSDANILQVMKPYARDLLNRSFESDRLLRGIGRDARQANSMLRATPKMLFNFLRQAAGGRHRVEFGFKGFERLDRQLERGVNRLTVALMISASTIAGSLVLNSPLKVIEIPLTWFGIEKVALTELLGLTGYGIATFLGIWLILSIFRSGKL